MLRFTFTITVLLLIISSCKREEKPLIKEEVLDFAKKIELSIGKRNASLLDDAIDANALIDKMDLGSGKDARAFRTSLSESIKMGTKILASLPGKGTYSFIKYYEKNKVHHMLFRLYADGMINYHDYELIRSGGQPKVADIYIYLSGENFSETLKSLYTEFKDDKASDPWIKKVPEIRSLINRNKHQEALDIYNMMPQNVRQNHTLQILHINICSGLSDEEYTKAISDYETLYPNEPNMQLLLIDAYIMRKDYEKALTAVNGLDKMIDKDPLLDYHRAMCYTLLKNDAKRVECLERLVKNIPDFEEGILELLASYLEKGDYEKAKPLIDRFKNISGFDQTMLNSLLDLYPGYGEKYDNK